MISKDTLDTLSRLEKEYRANSHRSDTREHWDRLAEELMSHARELIGEAKRAERYREALENVKKHMEMVVDPPHMSAVWNIANNSLTERSE